MSGLWTAISIYSRRLILDCDTEYRDDVSGRPSGIRGERVIAGHWIGTESLPHQRPSFGGPYQRGALWPTPRPAR